LFRKVKIAVWAFNGIEKAVMLETEYFLEREFCQS